jgi:hypothetical protein
MTEEHAALVIRLLGVGLSQDPNTAQHVSAIINNIMAAVADARGQAQDASALPEKDASGD